MLKPPLVYRLVNALRRWRERDDRLLVEQWKSAFAPETKAPKVRPFLNLRVSRSVSRKVA